MNIRQELVELIQDHNSEVDALVIARQLTEDVERTKAGEELSTDIMRPYAPEYYERVRNMRLDQILQPTPFLGVFDVMELRKEFGYSGEEGLGLMADVDLLVPFAERVVERSRERAPKLDVESES